MNLEDTGSRAQGTDSDAKAALSRSDATGLSGRHAVLARIRKALVSSRLTLEDGRDTGGDPYNSRSSVPPGSVWRHRSR